MIEILSDKLTNPETNKARLCGVIHSFTGTYEEAKKYIKLGFYIGFNGIITFPPSRKAIEGHSAGQYDKTVKNIPLENILLETDSPFLAPTPYRGQRNEPAYIIEVAKKVAELRNVSVEQVAEQTTQNAVKLFRLD
jgi:TatD DNase family protein